MLELPIKIQAILYAKTNDEIEYLLLKRTPQDGGFWQPVTGTLHDGEKLTACLAREMQEEVGLAQLGEVSDCLYKFDWQRSSGERIIEFVYAVQIPRNVEVVLAPDEHDDYKWCDYGGAQAILSKDNNKQSLERVNDFLTGKVGR